MPSLRSTVSFDNDFDGPAVTRQLVASLKDSYAKFVKVHDNRIEFGSGFFRLASNWSVLNSFYTGDIAVDAPARRIRYRVNITQLMVISTVMVGIMGLFMLITGGRAATWMLPLMWLWLVGVNVALGHFQLRSLIRKSVTAASDPLASAISARKETKARSDTRDP